MSLCRDTKSLALVAMLLIVSMLLSACGAAPTDAPAGTSIAPPEDIQVHAAVPALLDPEPVVAAHSGTPAEILATATPTRPIAPTPTPATTPTARQSPTPRATATSRTTQESVITPEVLKAQLTALTTVNIRSGPDTSWPVRGQLKKGQVVDIIGKTANGWWQIQLPDGTTDFVTNGSQYTTAQNTANVALVADPDGPTPAPTTPVRQETTSAGETVTIPEGLYLFPAPRSNPTDTTIGSQTLTILEKNGPFFKIDYPGVGVRWVHGVGLVVTTGTTSTVPFPKPTAILDPTSLEVVQAEIANTNPYFSGLKTESGRLIHRPVDLRTGMVSPWLFGSGGYLCQSSVNRVVDVGDTYGAYFSQAVLFPHIGTVTRITNPDANGAFTVYFRDQNGAEGSRAIDRTTKVYLMTTNPDGATGCVDPQIQGPPTSFFAVGRAVGFAELGTNFVMGAY